MSLALFLHVSCNIPNQWGLPQLLFENYNGNSVLENLLETLQNSRHLDHIYIVCSSLAVDDWIEELIIKLSKTKSAKTFHTLRIQDGHTYSFSEKNLKKSPNSPGKYIPTLGLYNLEALFTLKEQINFSKIILCWAENIILLTAKELDNIIDQFTLDFLSIGRKQAIYPFIITYYQKLQNFYQELKSETIQDSEIKRSTIIKQNASPEKITAFNNQIKKHFSIMDLANKFIDKQTFQRQIIFNQSLDPFCSLKTKTDFTKICQGLDFLNQSSINHNHFYDKISKKNLNDLLKKQTKLSSKLTKDKKLTLNLHNIKIQLPSNSILSKTIEQLKEVFKKINYVQTVSFEIQKELSFYDDLNHYIKELKNKSTNIELKIQLKNLNIPSLKSMILSGISAIKIQLNTTDKENIKNAINNLLLLKKDLNKNFDFPLIYLEIILTVKAVDFIQHLFLNFEYLVDRIIILPPEKTKDCYLDLSPEYVEKTPSRCFWTYNSLTINEKQQLQLCDFQKKSTYKLTPGSLNKMIQARANKKECLKCSFKNRKNGATSNFNFNNYLTHNKNNLVENYATFGYFISFIELAGEISELHKAYNIIMLIKYLNIPLEIKQAKYNIFLKLAKKMISFKLFDLAINIIEEILKTDPINNECHTLLDNLCKLDI